MELYVFLVAFKLFPFFLRSNWIAPQRNSSMPAFDSLFGFFFFFCRLNSAWNLFLQWVKPAAFKLYCLRELTPSALAEKDSKGYDPLGGKKGGFAVRKVILIFVDAGCLISHSCCCREDAPLIWIHLDEGYWKMDEAKLWSFRIFLVIGDRLYLDWQS